MMSPEDKKLFDLAYAVDEGMRSMLEEFNQRQVKLFDLATHRRIFLFIVTRSLKTYTSILLLCEKGFGQDVSPLLRSLLENLVTIEYILRDKEKADDLARRFVDYKWIILKRHLPEQEQQIRAAANEEKKEFFKKRALILSRVEEFKKNFKVTSDRALVTWSGKTVRDMAKEVDANLLEEYETTFRLCSRFSHPSILGDQEYVLQDGKQLIFSPLPSSIGVFPNLKNAIAYHLRLFKVINSLFEFRYEEKLKTCEKEFIEIRSETRKSRKEALSAKSEQPPHSIRESIIAFKTKI